MQGVKIKSTIELDLTTEQWQLYSTMPGVSAIAHDMNKRIMEALNAGNVNAAFAVLNKYASYGAADSEPHWVLQDIVNKMGLGEKNGIL